MDVSPVNAAKFAIAAGGTGLLLWGAIAARRGGADRHRRLRDALTLGLTVLAGLAWSNFLTFHHGSYGHPTDTYHYYLGSKYFRELGYTRLYECTAIADAQAGHARAVAQRSIRNLRTYQRESAAPLLANPERCTRHFSPERWRAFQRDVTWFREHMHEAYWKGAQADHGYNPPPAWGILGSALANTGPLTTARFVALMAIDPLLLLAMWGCAIWAFGWRGASAALIFWGTNHPAEYLWTGGSYLRQSWLAATVIGICLLRKRRAVGAGALLGYAALVRILPGFALAALALKGAASAWQTRSVRPTRAHVRIALGALLAAGLVVPLSALETGGFSAWGEFSQNIRFHAGTPFVTNIGLKTALSYEHATRAATFDAAEVDAGEAWRDARRATFERRRIAFAAVLVIYLMLLARAVAGLEDWAAAALGAGALFMATETSCYYFAALLCTGFLSERRAAIGVALCGLSALTWIIEWRFDAHDEVFAWTSVATVAFVIFSTLCVLRARSPTAPGSTPS